MKKALLIPIYEPNDKVVPFLKNFKHDDFDYFLVVNDGSNHSFDKIYQEIQEQTVFEVIGYETNQGKGHALKYGMDYLINKGELDLIVTADGDGQHAYKDILNVKDNAINNPNCLVLGSRNFYQEGLPRNSRVGNKFSSKYFKMSTGKRVKDTQTGLRAIPSELFHLALTTNGERYDYEMNFLMDAVRNYPYKEVDIETIYENQKNETSHFRPFVDSIKIYRTPLLYILISLLSFGIDIGFFHLFSTQVFTANSEQQVFLSTILARVISGVFNFLMFHFVVFQSRDDFAKKAFKYWILWTINLGCSSGLTYLFKRLPAHLTFIKFIIDTFLAIVNYIINLSVIFVRKKIKKWNTNPFGLS